MPFPKEFYIKEEKKNTDLTLTFGGLCIYFTSENSLYSLNFLKNIFVLFQNSKKNYKKKFYF